MLFSFLSAEDLVQFSFLSNKCKEKDGLEDLAVLLLVLVKKN